MDKNNHNPTSQHMNFHITFQRCSIAKLLKSYKKLSFMNSLKYASFNNTTYSIKQNPPAIHKINQQFKIFKKNKNKLIFDTS